MTIHELTETFLEIGQYLPVTIEMAIGGMVLAILVGILLTVLNRYRASQWFVRLYLLFFRGFPTLVIHFVFYYGLPELLNTGHGMTPFVSATICLALKEAAYLEEIFRSGIDAVDHGQVEAGTALGLNKFQVYRFIIIPQSLRTILPPTGNTFIGLLKETSLAFSIGVTEIFGQGKLLATENFQYFAVYMLVGIWYVILILLYTIFQRFLERRLAY